jgi:periplasmic mercuric ion binding protein
MKTKALSLIGMFLTGTIMVFAQAKTEKFEVKGNCGMCESRIEKAAKSLEGVTSADWNQKTKILEVNYDVSKTSTAKIQQTVADTGHDTPMQKAKDEVYNKLPACCKYERSGNAGEKKVHEGHNH